MRTPGGRGGKRSARAQCGRSGPPRSSGTLILNRTQRAVQMRTGKRGPFNTGRRVANLFALGSLGFQLVYARGAGSIGGISNVDNCKFYLRRKNVMTNTAVWFDMPVQNLD